MIRVRHATFSVPARQHPSGRRVLLAEVDFEVSTGSISTVVGRNGVGKSTLMRAIAGEQAPDRGQVCYGSCEVMALSPHARAQQCSVLLQHTNAAFSLRCAELIEFGTYAVYHQLTRKQRQHICAEASAHLDVVGFAKRPIDTLSGGERQRVYLAKCLAQLRAGRAVGVGAQALLLDEPTTALDVAQQARILSLVRTLAQDEQFAVLCVLHDLNLAAQFSDQLILLESGGCLAVGTPTHVLTPAHLRQALGVEMLVQTHPYLDCPLLSTLHLTHSPRDERNAHSSTSFRSATEQRHPNPIEA